MQFSNKRLAAFATILMLTLAIPLVAIPLANAHDPPWNITCFAYINAAPNPVGVGQKVDILIWVDKPRASAALSNNYRMHNYRLIITDADGNEVLNEFWTNVTDPTSSQYYPWTPSTVGTYTLTFNFEGFNASSFDTASSELNDYFVPDSASTTLVVQEEQLPNPITSYPLPAEYWARPIYGENTDWWSISSNWLGEGSPTLTAWPSVFGSGGNVAGIDRDPGAGVGPATNHIMWTKPLQMGGVVGDNNFPIPGNTWFEGSAYSQRYQNPIILAGRLYYNPPLSFTGVSDGPTTCVDLRTGEVIWERSDVPHPSFGIIYDVEDPQQHGVYPAMLVAPSGGGFFGGAVTWHIYDAWTGDFLVDVTGIPTGTPALGPQGEYLIYTIVDVDPSSTNDYRMRLWNSSLLWTGTGWADPTSSGLSPAWDTDTTTTTTNVTTTTYVNGSLVITETPTTTSTTAVDGSIDSGSHTRYSWDIPMPDLNAIPKVPAAFPFLPPSDGFAQVGVSAYNDVMVLRVGTQPGLTPAGFGTTSQAPYSYMGINLNQSSTNYNLGETMWTTNLQPPERNITVTTGIIDPVSRVFTESYKETTQHVGFDLDKGNKLWTTNGQAALDYYGNPSVPWIASAAYEGKLYSCSYGGIVYAYDLRNGSLLWTYGNGGEGNSTNSGFYLAYGHYPTQIGGFASGMIYVFTSEHTVNTPIYKGALWRAINATTGEEVWTLSGYTGTFFVFSNAIADGFLTYFNGYDNRVYSVGRGPSATTVTAPDAGLASGQPVVIKGTVMDVSPGLKLNNEIPSRFPKGVPAVSDASMKDWMGYVWQQRPFPSNCTGVPVTIDVMDSNGNYRTIGTAISDASGTFSLTWTPDIPGNYTVIASFRGNKAYWPSYAENSFTVMNPPEATPPPTPTPASNTDAYVAGFGIALIIIIVAGLVVIVLMLRRR
jgi:hypothetical protein